MQKVGACKAPRNAICRVLPKRTQTGKRPQAPSNRPLQPPKRQKIKHSDSCGNSAYPGGVLPRRCKSLIVKEDPNHYFSSRFFRVTVFSRIPEFRVFGRFEGGFRACATSCPRLPVARNRPVSRDSVISYGIMLDFLASAWYHMVPEPF